MARLAAALTLLFFATGLSPSRAEFPTLVASGFSVRGLERVRDYLRNEVATGKIPGAVLLIQRHGQRILLESFGVKDAESRRPMTDDSIFRLYSMSKPVTSVAAMMLVDDGKISLDDPLSKFIPVFAGTKVAVEKHDENGKVVLATEPAARPITILDLLRQTSGITYGFYGDNPVRQLYAKSNLFDGDVDNAELAERLAKLPLAEQPGTLWDYGHSTDVLGRVIEVVSGKSLYAFEKERLLDPLGMIDTAFRVDDSRRSRVAEPLPGDVPLSTVKGLGDPVQRRRWQSGGGGMVGTADDYARFAQMLLNGGQLDGRRYLKPETVSLMTSDLVPPESGIARDYYYFPSGDSGFGLGFAVRVVENPLLPTGEYRWDGAGGTFFFVDPKDDMFAVCMLASPSQRQRIQIELKKLIYQALEKQGP
ncbi:CubicO group peptidase, beta-lactamase class C family [Bradyrhizobium erythrophlei]|uniref:CubicO group peptidase, beta-lactamase class C family n=1 Tax=Bradyrhizobium erythrophlei TaxID=1437360 RepID=A0A1M7UJU0_9BRAD|nr:CubicO group peptidase, beta-lactamase class C family [Bradyrhizobium erythrophlei]